VISGIKFHKDPLKSRICPFQNESECLCSRFTFSVGIQKQIDYVSKSGRQSVATNATLEMCSTTCQVMQLSVSIKLRPDQTDVDCEVDADAISSRNHICGKQLVVIAWKHLVTSLVTVGCLLHCPEQSTSKLILVF